MNTVNSNVTPAPGWSIVHSTSSISRICGENNGPRGCGCYVTCDILMFTVRPCSLSCSPCSPSSPCSFLIIRSLGRGIERFPKEGPASSHTILTRHGSEPRNRDRTSAPSAGARPRGPRKTSWFCGVIVQRRRAYGGLQGGVGHAALGRCRVLRGVDPA